MSTYRVIQAGVIVRECDHIEEALSFSRKLGSDAARVERDDGVLMSRVQTGKTNATPRMRGLVGWAS